MVIEEFVSFETGKLLKEKGFDADTKMFWCTLYDVPYIEYIGDIENCSAFEVDNSNGLDVSENFVCTAPTQQMAMRWLREVHKLFITIEIKGDPRMESFIYYKWSVAKYSSCQIERVDNGLHTPEDYWYAKDEEDETYELACEAAIKYCLENLI